MIIINFAIKNKKKGASAYHEYTFEPKPHYEEKTSNFQVLSLACLVHLV